MREIRRVLKPGGWAVLLVPDVVEQGDFTLEDPSVTERADRLRRYGQADHVRVYGWDYADRLAAAGLDVEAVRMDETLDEATIERCRLRKFGIVEPIFASLGARRPASSRAESFARVPRCFRRGGEPARAKSGACCVTGRCRGSPPGRCASASRRDGTAL